MTTLPLDFVSNAVAAELVARIKADLRKRVLEQIEREIEPILTEAARDLALRVKQYQAPLGDTYLQVAIDGVRRPDVKVERA